MLLVEPVVIRPLLVEWGAEKTAIAARAGTCPRPGRRVPAHPPLALLHHQLRDPREHELSAPQQLLFGQLLQLVEELAGLRTLDAEALGEVREQLALAHPAGLSPPVSPLPSCPWSAANPRSHPDPAVAPQPRLTRGSRRSFFHRM